MTEEATRERTDQAPAGGLSRLRHLVLVRHRENWGLLLRFGLVGGSGVLVNMLVMMAANALGPAPEAAAMNLAGTAFHVRWYHVYSIVAFLVANVWNFQLNRRWTFRSAGRASWWSEYLPFLVVGALGQAIGLAVLTGLMHPHSPIALSSAVFDDSSLLRTKVYWAQLIMVIVVTPLSFLLNKVWTFRAARASRGGREG